MISASSQNYRLPAVADQFYPADKIRLERMVSEYLQLAEEQETDNVKALIVPHAGYIYSAATAASAYKVLSSQAESVRQVVLLGPSHRVGFKGIATSSANFYSMPFGEVKLEDSLKAKISHLPQVIEMDKAHQHEHSLEVQLPFLQLVLKDFTLLPLVVGDCSAQDVSEVIEHLWGNDQTLFVISSDLSHFLPYDAANEIDHHTAQAILELSPAEIQYDHACGRNPVNGLLISAKKHNLEPKLTDLRNSGDTAGSRDRVVGYGAFTFSENSDRNTYV